VAVFLYASEYAIFGDDQEYICLKRMPFPSKKTNLQMFLERLSFLINRGKLVLISKETFLDE